MREFTTDHPAKFSDEIVEVLRRVILDEQRRIGRVPLVLDPFAGVGRIHRAMPTSTVGIELEPEWAACHLRTVNGNALALPFAADTFDVVATSPCYGNRMADHHNARDGSKRRTYTHTLGRDLHPDNAGAMQWGDEYRAFHARTWAEARRVLKPGGLFVLNISDHIRGGKVRHVVAWHAMALGALGFEWVDDRAIETRRMKHGENRDARVDHEVVLVLRAVSDSACLAGDEQAVPA